MPAPIFNAAGLASPLAMGILAQQNQRTQGPQSKEELLRLLKQLQAMQGVNYRQMTPGMFAQQTQLPLRMAGIELRRLQEQQRRQARRETIARRGPNTGVRLASPLQATPPPSPFSTVGMRSSPAPMVGGGGLPPGAPPQPMTARSRGGEQENMTLPPMMPGGVGRYMPSKPASGNMPDWLLEEEAFNMTPEQRYRLWLHGYYG